MIKRKSSRKRGSKRKKGGSKRKKLSRKKRTSNTRLTWEQFLKHKDSMKVLKESWKAKNPQKHYAKTIKTLARKYSSKRKK
jgi:hypothetical protein